MEEVVYNEKDLGMRDYPRGHLKGSVSVTKVRNAFKPFGYALAKTSHNEVVNGVRRGSCGHIIDPKTNRHVYFDTESAAAGYMAGQILYRASRHDRDWTGGRNNWCSPENFCECVRHLMELPLEAWVKQF